MACHLNDNVYTQTFTPREYQVELLDTAKHKNTVVCSSTSSAKTFIAIKLLQEMAWEMRKKHGKKALFVLDLENIHIMSSHIKLLTDLTVFSITELVVNIEKLDRFVEMNCVIVTTAEVCSQLLLNRYIQLKNVCLLVVDDCLYEEKQWCVEQIMIHYKELDNDRPRILGLAAGLLGPELKAERLEGELQRLEKILCSSVDTSSELVTLLRLCSRPHEHLIECESGNILPLHKKLEAIIHNAQQFLTDHRFDPSEIYSDEFLEELRQVPDPKEQPMDLLQNFLNILYEFGPWAADQAALSLLSLIEKLKVKVPYERHFLLLCMVSTVMVMIRAICDDEFEAMTDQERIYQFSTPKIHKFLEILKQFKPSGEKPVELIENHVQEVQVVHSGLPLGKLKMKPRPCRRAYLPRAQQEDRLCALIFVQNRFTAKVIYSLLYTVSQCDDDFWWISALYSVEKIANPITEPKEAENEHRRQEEVLRKYRTHDCNIMVATSVLEQGYDLPKCNLVIRLDLPITFHSYVQSKARARASDAYYLIFVNENELYTFVKQLSEYMEVERTLLRRCHGLEPSPEEEIEADMYTNCLSPYKPVVDVPDAPCVTLATSIALVNRYCAKLPSDTFTRLTPLWNVKQINGKYTCTLRLPINSPVKTKISNPPVVNPLLACRVTAYLTCQMLHKVGELDDNLQPVGKENFRASEEDWNNFALETTDEELTKGNVEPRPGTTKRRQYYYKRVADAFTHCRPIANSATYFYRIVMTLTCPLPEEQNTRGRKIYPPEESLQGFGILTSKQIPKICPFPIFTRSGEVRVDLQLCDSNLLMTDEQIHKINEFLNYTFTNVLRLQRYLMLFDPLASDNSYLIVPTYIAESGHTEVHWEFIDLIYRNRRKLPELVPEEERVGYVFDPSHYKDAVVMPWYRNQDQPQYFYVAEICNNLNPRSNFPGSEYATFEEYYLRKYSIQIQNSEQHLLDVDHTSARLNFLTPRYVNRKGVALPTSSEETKKAKRENLEQKQILVPELCAIHPFPASLWRKAVCLPCILYRVNALLLADQIRQTVAIEMHLGKLILPYNFKWPPLNFGWNLSDVLKKSKEDLKKIEIIKKEEEYFISSPKIIEVCDEKQSNSDSNESKDSVETTSEKDELEIGMWSNDMADMNGFYDQSVVRYASPTSWMNNTTYDDFSETESSYSLEDNDSDCGGLRIEFMGDNTAEAVEEEERSDIEHTLRLKDVWSNVGFDEESEILKLEFENSCKKNIDYLMSGDVLVRKHDVLRKNDENKCNDYKEPKYPSIEEPLQLEHIINDHMSNSIKMTPAIFVLTDNKVKNRTLQFSFDEQPDLELHPGPSPSVILQALTMSNANDGINLERLETIGDSFLKYAITNYLYSKYENVHEGKLSHLRSKQVSNLNLYRLGKRKALGECMIATKFDPHDNWLPPCYYVPKELEEALLDARVPANYWSPAAVAATRDMTLDEICQMVREHGEALDIPSIIPYNLVTQHSIPDKSIADCVEALIGAYLIECGPRGALLFMAWLGIRVLPQNVDGTYGEVHFPNSPLLRNVPNPEKELEILLDGYNEFENNIGYNFCDRSYLLQALTHASYSPNTLTDCYQRLEFLGDAVLDYLITRHLYEDSRKHSPGALTDLRSALVNNTIFASLAVRHGFHKYFRHLSPGLHEVVERFVRIQEETGHALVEELYLLAEYECEEVEDVEVPKALGDVFESVAGAIFLDSGMSLDAVWSVYYQMMHNEIEKFCDKVPKSPIRELLELEPETAKFGKPEKLADGRRVRVTVEVFGKGVFKGIGRNYRIAKCTAAKCALKHLKRRGMLRRC